MFRHATKILEMLTKFCMQSYTFSCYLKHIASMEICPPCCPLCDHPFCADPKICPKHAPELVKSKEVSGKAKKILRTLKKIIHNLSY